MQLLPIACLRAADSPRLAGEDDLHAQTLAETDAPLPPILVHRGTMRVIDGMHRLRAAVLRGETQIAARLFDGTVEAAFVLAVQANVTHGLPLSLADREAAAQRILRSHPHWSDRAVATAAGLRGEDRGEHPPAGHRGPRRARPARPRRPAAPGQQRRGPPHRQRADQPQTGGVAARDRQDRRHLPGHRPGRT
ncbi:ParB/RepB/Spo0J family partition protein [Micromonospora sp. BRA006-A]|nr:ParB/RepB/Spo0J family partition protein [Micromonospora sp. BRA006-A]